MEIKEVNNWITAIEDDIRFLQKEIRGIKEDNTKKLKEMQSSLNYKVDEIRGLHQLAQAKTQVKPDVSSYLLKKIEVSPEFQSAVKKLESGDNVDMTLGVKMKNKELPLEIRHDGRGTWTKEFDSRLDDEVITERVEERLKTKEFVKDKDGIHYDE